MRHLKSGDTIDPKTEVRKLSVIEILHRYQARKRTPEIEAAIRVLWEETDEWASKIGQRYGMTKNAVIGVAHRRQWEARRVTYRTMDQRLDEVWATFKAKIKELEPQPSHYVRGNHPLDVHEGESPKKKARFVFHRSSAQ